MRRAGGQRRGRERARDAATLVGAAPIRSALALALALLLPAAAAAGPSAAPHEGVRLAYIDPGTGSFMVQAIIAAIAGMVVTLRLYWSKVKALFGVSSEESAEDDASESDAPR